MSSQPSPLKFGRGRRFRGKQAIEPAPPLRLSLLEQSILAQLRRTPAGLALDGSFPLSCALRLLVARLARVAGDAPQRLMAR